MTTSINNSPKKVTIADIAREVGVAKSTVSFVLNKRKGEVAISDAMRERVLEVVRRRGYQSNPIAQALVTKRTGHLGFILSDDMAGGFENMFFAAYLSSVEEECRKRGYNLSISRYNLSRLDAFIFPAAVHLRSIDGVILAGYVEAGVLRKFRENGIPCVCLGDYTEIPEPLTTISSDITGCIVEALKYGSKLGHRRIGLHYPTRRKDLEAADAVKRDVANHAELRQCECHFFYTPNHLADYGAAKQLMIDYMSMPEAARPTLMIVTDQTAMALLGEIRQFGLSCPEDISVIATSDTLLCAMAVPTLTAISLDMAGQGRLAVSLLLDHIINHAELTPAQSKNDFSGTIVERQSCKVLSVL